MTTAIVANSISQINPQPMNGELRVLDTELGKRLGFANPVKIRELIKRHKVNLEKIGVLPTVGKTSSGRGGRPTEEYYLNRKQAIFITAKSETAEATDITIEIIHRFDAYERGEIASQHNTVTIADIEQNMRSVMGGISKRVLGKGLEPVISTLEAQSTHIRLLEAKLDQVLMLLDRPSPNPNTVVPQHKAHRQEEGDDILVVKALQQLGGKATPRAIMRRLGTAKWNALRRDIAIASLVESGHVVIEKALTKPSPGRPTMDVVRLTQVPFHKTPA